MVVTVRHIRRIVKRTLIIVIHHLELSTSFQFSNPQQVLSAENRYPQKLLLNHAVLLSPQSTDHSL